ncbi:bifunctional DNA primase/polymerase [Streptomyces sp. NPDC051664]|uniref:bifunctional DNA primase/polymerase n=1 Tax=Streptomyces sp. NPDC051664 TaxID=3365668 RepID=UPI0037A07210
MPLSPADVSPPEHRPAPLDVARWCAAQGWPVLPLAPGRKTPPANCDACQERGHSHVECSCLAAGRWCHGFHAATTDNERLAAWWFRNPGLGTAVACGPAGLVVIDVDAHFQSMPPRDRLLPGIAIPEHVDLTGLRHGFHTLALLAALRGQEDPALDVSTLRVRTPSGGLHIWYQTSPGARFQCSTGSSPRRALAWQVDVRATGGYIIAPGTTTAAGNYAALGTVRTPATLPDWLAWELARTGHIEVPKQGGTRGSLHGHPVPPRARLAVVAAGGGRDKAAQILETVLADVVACAAVPEGAGFTQRLNRAAYTAGGLVTAGYLTTDAVARALLDTAEYARPGHDRRSAQIIRSGLDAGARRPLHLEGRPS